MKLISSIIKTGILIAAFAALLTSCTTTKGCGDPAKWEKKHSFNK